MEGDDDELGDSDCLPRLRTKWRLATHVRIRIYVTRRDCSTKATHVRIRIYVTRRDCSTKATHVRIRTPFIVILCTRANPPRRLFEGGVYFTQRLQLCGVYSRAASIRGNTVYIIHTKVCNKRFNAPSCDRF